jgi:DNA-binding NarL/FixJ family response regulator
MPTVFGALRRGPGETGERDRDALTEREEEVVALLARGLSNAEIAGELVVTHKTVRNHAARVYAKLGVHSRAEAVATWLGIKEGGSR